MRASKPVQVQESEPELVSAVKPLELVREREPELVREREPEPVQVREPLQLELAQVRVLEPPLARKPAQQSELAVILMQARELRVSRQLELQQHRLPTAAQEQLPYRPVLPMKAPY